MRTRVRIHGAAAASPHAFVSHGFCDVGAGNELEVRGARWFSSGHRAPRIDLSKEVYRRGRCLASGCRLFHRSGASRTHVAQKANTRAASTSSKQVPIKGLLPTKVHAETREEAPRTRGLFVFWRCARPVRTTRVFGERQLPSAHSYRTHWCSARKLCDVPAARDGPYARL